MEFNKTGFIVKENLSKVNSSMIPDINKTETIYHYTSIGGTKSILDRKKLWFTNIDYMNDKREAFEGLNQFEKIADKVYGKEFGEKAKAIIAKYKKQKNQVFVCCFSLDKDELAMWNYYTKDINSQGYNIGFNYKNLVVSLLKNNEELHGCGFSFGKVDYCLSENTYASKAYDMLTETLKGVYSTIDSDVDKKSISPEFDLPYVKFFGEEPVFKQSPSFNTVYYMKQPCFAKENEFRIVIRATDEALKALKDSDKYKFRESHGALIPYIELDFNIEDVMGITLSPTVQSDLAIRGIEDFCFYCGIDTSDLKEGIRKSKIPVRF